MSSGDAIKNERPQRSKNLRARSRLVQARRLAIVGLACGVCVAIACEKRSPSEARVGGLRETLTPLDNGSPTDAGVDAWIDCVGVLHVINLRGVLVANATRFGKDAATLRTTARLADLGPEDLRAFCDWEACIRANGYAHVCTVQDGGWEKCRVCRGGEDCEGRPMSQDDCVAHAKDPGRAQCHVGLLQECLLQRALRGPGFPCVTRTCELSEEACAGRLPGDRTAEALAAQHETDQVSVEEFKAEIAIEATRAPDSSYVGTWQRRLATWDGGSSSCGEQDAGEGGALDAAATD